MNHKLFAVLDSKAGAFPQPPFMALSRADALRSFSDAVNKADNQLNAHPEDFTLYEIADYDILTADIKPHAKPDRVALASDLKKNA